MRAVWSLSHQLDLASQWSLWLRLSVNSDCGLEQVVDASNMHRVDLTRVRKLRQNSHDVMAEVKTTVRAMVEALCT